MEFQYDLSPFIAFRDRAECERVRAIKKADITAHPNPDFKISVIEEPVDLFGALATDLVFNIQQALAEGRQFVCILPVGPTAQYPVAARMINRLRIPMHHVHTFNMDEYADQDGKTAPASWAGSFQKAMMDTFFGLIDPDLRPPMTQVHFPSSENINDYGKMLADLGDADVCYGGIGWCGHIAFWEADLGYEFGDDLDSLHAGRPAHRAPLADDDHAERPALLRRRLVVGAAQGRQHRPGPGDAGAAPQLLAAVL